MSLTGLPLLRVMGLQLTTGSGRKSPKQMDFLPVLERGPKKILLSSRAGNIVEERDGNEHLCPQEGAHNLTKLLLERQGNDRTSTRVTDTKLTALASGMHFA